MTAFDWAGLWAEACEAYDTVDAKRAICAERDEAASAYLRERIEAAFVPVETYHRDTGIRDVVAIEATARAEAAEARNKVLEEALRPIAEWADEARLMIETITSAGGDVHPIILQIAARGEPARQALGGEHE